MTAAAEAAPTAERRGIPIATTPPGGTFWNKLPVRITVVLIAAIWTLPTFGLLITSFRRPNEIRSSGWWTVFTNPFMETWTMANYADVFTSEGMLNAFVNSLIVTIPATVIPITMAAFAAYAFAWMKFPGRAVLFVVVVSLLVVPLQMALVPLLRGYVTFGLTGTFLGIWLAHTGFGLPLAIYLLIQLHFTASQGPVRVGVYRRRLAFHSLHSAGAPAVGSGIGVVRHLPVSLGVERPPGGAGLSR